MNRTPVCTLIVCTVGVLMLPQQSTLAVHAQNPVAQVRAHVTVGVDTRTPTPTITIAANPRASRAQMRRIPPVWRRLAWCESRWHLHSVSRSGKHHGLWQIHEGWFKSAGVNYHTASIEQQYQVARYVYRKQGARAWSCARKAGLR